MKQENALHFSNFLPIYTVMISVPTFQIVAPKVAGIADSAAWLVPPVAGILFLPILWMLKRVHEAYPGCSFDQINQALFGKFFGKVISGIYIIWLIFLAGYYLRRYGDRITSTLLFTDTNRAVFYIGMLFAVLYALKLGVKAWARAGNLIAYGILFAAVLFCLVLMKEVHGKNFLPVSFGSTVPILRSGLVGVSLQSYLLVFMVFADHWLPEPKFAKKSLYSLGTGVLVVEGLFVLVLGMFGAPLLSKMNIPFFAATRNLLMFHNFERVEALFISVLIVSDFLMVLVFSSAALHLLCNLFRTKNKSIIADILVVLIFMLTMWIGSNMFRVEKLNAWLVLPTGLIFGIGIPVLWVICGKIRRKI